MPPVCSLQSVRPRKGNCFAPLKLDHSDMPHGFAARHGLVLTGGGSLELVWVVACSKQLLIYIYIYTYIHKHIHIHIERESRLKHSIDIDKGEESAFHG